MDLQRDSCEAQAAVSLLKQTSESFCVACHIRGSVGGGRGREHLARCTAHNEVSNGANSNQATIVLCVLTAALSSSGLWCTMAGNEHQDRDVEGTQQGGHCWPQSEAWTWTTPQGPGSRPELSSPHCGLQSQVCQRRGYTLVWLFVKSWDTPEPSFGLKT